MDRLRNVIVLLRSQLWIIPLALSGLALGILVRRNWLDSVAYGTSVINRTKASMIDKGD